MREFGHSDIHSWTADVRAAVVGSTQISAPMYDPFGSALTTGDTDWAFSSQVRTVSLPLDGAGSDVLVRIAAPTCDVFCLPGALGQAALMIDDLVLE